MYCGYITTIKEIHDHSNADRLKCATIFGNNVIVDLSYSVGDRVVYFPVDGQLGEEYAEENNLLRKKDADGNNVGGYLDANKRNIKAIRLRGEQSDGLVLPIATLAKYTDVSKLTDGEHITVLNGVEICRKYIPKTNRRRGGSRGNNVNNKELREKISYPYFTEHRDTEQLAYNESAFHEGDIIYLTRKLHGTSFRVGNCLEVKTKKRNRLFSKLFGKNEKTNYKLISGTRRVVLRDYDGGFYGSNAFRQKYLEMFEGKLPKGMTVYGEIVGWVDDNTPIMPRCNNSKVNDKDFKKMYGSETIFTYGCEPGKNKCYIYRITLTSDDGTTVEIPTEETIRWCEILGVEYVPLVDKFLYTTFEDLNKRCEPYLDIPEPIANGRHIAEGVVVRIDNRSKFTAYKTKGFLFKVISGVISDNLTDEEIEKYDDDIISEI